MFQGFFGEELGYSAPVDDVVIGYRMSSAASFPNNNTLGAAATTAARLFDPLRGTLPLTTVAGVMEFNTDLIQILELSEADILLIILHEMGMRDFGLTLNNEKFRLLNYTFVLLLPLPSRFDIHHRSCTSSFWECYGLLSMAMILTFFEKCFSIICSNKTGSRCGTTSLAIELRKRLF